MDPWSKGDYSRHIREASMAMEGLPEVVPPSGRVPGQLLLAAPILKRQRRRYREEFGNKRSILGVSSKGAKYRPRGHRGGPPGTQEGRWRALPPGRSTRAPGPLVVALWPHFGDSGSFRDADFLYNFSRIFEALLMAEKPEIQNCRKQELVTGCTELIG